MSISIAEAARMLQIEQKQLYQKLKNGQLISKNLNGHRVISQGALLEYLARKKDRFQA